MPAENFITFYANLFLSFLPFLETFSRESTKQKQAKVEEQEEDE